MNFLHVNGATYASGDPVNNSDPSGMSTYSQYAQGSSTTYGSSTSGGCNNDTPPIVEDAQIVPLPKVSSSVRQILEKNILVTEGIISGSIYLSPLLVGVLCNGITIPGNPPTTILGYNHYGTVNLLDSVESGFGPFMAGLNLPLVGSFANFVNLILRVEVAVFGSGGNFYGNPVLQDENFGFALYQSATSSGTCLRIEVVPGLFSPPGLLFYPDTSQYCTDVQQQSS